MSFKVAVLWPGDIRLFNHTYSNYCSTVLGQCGGGPDLEVDLYVSTYDTAPVDKFSELYKPKAIDIQSKHEVKFFSEKKLQEINSRVDYNRWVESKPINIVSMYYKIQRCWRVFQEQKDKDYDIVVRYRDKIILGVPIIEKLKILVDDNSIFIPQHGDWRGGVGDVFAIGTEKGMEKYFNGILGNLESYLSQGCHFHPEPILLWHLVSQQIKLIRKAFSICLMSETKSGLFHTDLYTVRQPV